MKIPYRFSINYQEWSEVPAAIGMVIAGKVDDSGKYLDPGLGYFGDFSYIIEEISIDGVYTRDLGHNNRWFIRAEELSKYELVYDWHPNNEDVDAHSINSVLC